MTFPSDRGRQSVLGFSAVLLAAGLLSGCGTADTGLQRSAARQLQARVLEVTQASSQDNPAAALKALEGLEAELEAAQTGGRISEERRRSITTIAAAVRADLNDAVAAAAADKAAAEEQAAKETQAAETRAPAVETPAPAPVPETSTGKKDNEGKGKGNG
ncbi:hypothetical protein [Pseudarthrobacter sp. GA104]|uniref:FIMAH domain-containing protein n=1 Tax=Pseudarthrobacter sp. GA104 TaxID=2676311 RepID=UPI001384E6CC|nr:hypothetical protein [Pseudarthrobacter sp. GA104]HET7782839.1 hypothetical protein [Arthrobacter sp.]